MIVVFGTVCLDRLRRVPRLPERGGYVEATSEERMLGGEAANTAVALRTWGEPHRLATHPLGDDPDGHVVRELARARGLEPVELGVGGEAAVCDVYVTPDGERTMFGKGFTDAEGHVSLAALPVEPGAWFTAEPNMPERAREAVAKAHAGGMRVWAMDFVRPEDVLPPGSVWQTSAYELPFRDDETALLEWVGAQAARQPGVTAVVTDGPHGLILSEPGLAPVRFPAFPAPVVVDTTGAGDGFRAGCLRTLARGGSLREALMFGAANGALICGHAGATSRVPTIAEIESLIVAHPDVASSYGSPTL